MPRYVTVTLARGELPRNDFFFGFSPLALVSQISLLVSRRNGRLRRRCRMRRFYRSESRRQRSCGDSWNGSSFRYLVVLVLDCFSGRRLDER
jgi:hypothetical protein